MPPSDLRLVSRRASSVWRRQRPANALVRLGLPSHDEDVHEDRSGVARGDNNRSARLARLRAAVPVTDAVVGLDLAEKEQMVVVSDQDSRVQTRRTFRCKAWSP
jgi:hypothetical protein